MFLVQRGSQWQLIYPLPRVSVQPVLGALLECILLPLSIFRGIYGEGYCRIAGEERCQFGATQHGAHLLPASITPPGEVILSGRFSLAAPRRS